MQKQWGSPLGGSLFAGTLVTLLIIYGRPTFSILTRTQTEVTSTFITSRNERRNNMFSKTASEESPFGHSSKKIKNRFEATHHNFCFGSLTDDGRHILTPKNKSTSVE